MAYSAKEELSKAPKSESVPLIDFESAEVIGGFVNDTYFLIVSGTKPYLNMEVRLLPSIYIDRPEYWRIEVAGFLPGFSLPALGPYSVHLDLAGVIGTKGIEVVGATRSEFIDIPSQAHQQDNIGEWRAEIDNSGTKPQIIVDGTFPTNGEEPLFSLEKAAPQGPNPTELILVLMFGNLVDPNGGGQGSARYSAPVNSTDDFKTVLLRDPNGRKLANINVE